MLKVNNNSNNELEIIYNNITLIKHSTEKPAFFHWERPGFNGNVSWQLQYI